MYKFTKKLNWFIACFARGKSGQLRAACFLTGRVFLKTQLVPQKRNSQRWQWWKGEVRAHRDGGDTISEVNLMRWKTK